MNSIKQKQYTIIPQGVFKNKTQQIFSSIDCFAKTEQKSFTNCEVPQVKYESGINDFQKLNTGFLHTYVYMYIQMYIYVYICI